MAEKELFKDVFVIWDDRYTDMAAIFGNLRAFLQSIGIRVIDDTSVHESAQAQGANDTQLLAQALEEAQCIVALLSPFSDEGEGQVPSVGVDNELRYAQYWAPYLATMFYHVLVVGTRQQLPDYIYQGATAVTEISPQLTVQDQEKIRQSLVKESSKSVR